MKRHLHYQNQEYSIEGAPVDRNSFFPFFKFQ
jgi:hypothetical protein